MRMKSIQKHIGRAVAKLAQAERSGKTEAVQEAYEDLFVLCYENQLGLQPLLREAEEHRHARVAS